MTSKDSDIRHRDSPASSTNYTSERRLDKAGEGEGEREDCCWGWRVASYL
jgi:hypothetical protein